MIKKHTKELFSNNRFWLFLLIFMFLWINSIQAKEKQSLNVIVKKLSEIYGLLL